MCTGLSVPPYNIEDAAVYIVLSWDKALYTGKREKKGGAKNHFDVSKKSPHCFSGNTEMFFQKVRNVFRENSTVFCLWKAAGRKKAVFIKEEVIRLDLTS